MQNCSLLRFVLAVGVLFAGGCSSATEPIASALSMYVEPSRAAFVPGDTIHLAVTVFNQSRVPVEVTGSSSCLLAFHVLDRSGQPVAASDRVCTRDLYQRTIPARGSVTQSLVWAGNTVSGIDRLPMLPTGTYRVVGVLNASEGRLHSAPTAVKLEAP